jgi:ABC-type sugar transport system permease subunit
MVLVVTIIIIPFGQAIYYSFTKFSAMSPPVWVGLHNYSKLLQTPLFLSSIKNNALIALASPLFVFLPLVLAATLFRYRDGWTTTARMTVLLPYALSMTVVGVMFRSFLWTKGPVNEVLTSIGLERLALDWLGDPTLGLLIIIGVALWKDFGWYVMVYIAGLSTISRDLFDSAKVDGANSVQQFVHIIVPGLNAIIVLVTTLVLIADFRAMFDYVFNLTRGGPGYATYTVEFLLYREAFNFFRFGFACSLGVVMFVIIFGFSYFQIRIMSRTT